MKPAILYLDVDEVIIRQVHTREEHQVHVRNGLWKGIPAPGAKEFLEFILPWFEVRWLTSWAGRGRMNARDAAYLEKAIGLPMRVFHSVIQNPLGWRNGDLGKPQGIDFADPRPAVWVEDGVPPDEMAYFEEKRRPDQQYFWVDTTWHPSTLQQLLDRWKINLPFTP